MLDIEFYNHAEVTSALDWQAFAVVVCATSMAGVGSAIAAESDVLVGLGVGAATGIIGWLVWSLITLGVGVRVFGGDADYGQMRRDIGFAFAPLAIGIVPWLGFVGAAWSLVASTIGIREGMDFSTKAAILTVIAGWVAWLLLSVVLQLVAGFSLSPLLTF